LSLDSPHILFEGGCWRVDWRTSVNAVLHVELARFLDLQQAGDGQ
jgi:hypothetical protein